MSLIILILLMLEATIRTDRDYIKKLSRVQNKELKSKGSSKTITVLRNRVTMKGY
jgi:hypothetical protein